MDHAKLGNITGNCSSTVESPCLREACKVPSALEIAVTPYSHLVGMFYRLSKNVSPSPDSMFHYDVPCYVMSNVLTPCYDFMFYFYMACKCLLCFPVADHSIQHKMSPL